MCDTWIALKDSTSEGNVIFAKNSDRPAFDCQPLLLRPRNNWPAGSTIQTEYAALPQAEVTFAHIGSSPYWCWGYEEGLNEWGVVIGNEAIFTKTYREAAAGYLQGRDTPLGLLGMDLIRLGLERSRTARQAVECISGLVEKYGQFGSGSPGKSHADGSYDNSFIIADPQEAWILETAGQRWAAKCFQKGVTSISNQPTIRSDWDLASPDLKAYAMQKKWWPENAAADFDFAQAYIDDKTSRQVSHIRLMRSRQLLAEQHGQVTTQWMKRIARDHYEDTFLQGPYFNPADPDFLSLCMHVSPADFTWGNTASSCVVVLPRHPWDPRDPRETGGLPVFWWTPGPPCNGCYVPFFVHGSRLPEIVSRAGTAGKQAAPADRAVEDTFAPDSYWWLFRRLLDRVKGDPVKSLPGCYPARNRLVRERFDALEQEFEAQLPAVLASAAAKRETDTEGMAAALDDFSEGCVKKVVAAVEELLAAI